MSYKRLYLHIARYMQLVHILRDGMTDLVVIDESGDLGSQGSTYFVMAAMIIPRPRNLKSVYKLIPRDGKEHKWYNSDEDEKQKILDLMATCNYKIVYTSVNKNSPTSTNPIYGNKLYDLVTTHVIQDALSHLGTRDVKVFLDNNGFITTTRLKEIVQLTARLTEVNPLDVGKRDSQSTPCLQLVDYVVGSIRANYEYSEELHPAIEKKLSFARTL